MGNETTSIEIIDVQSLQRVDTGFDQLGQQGVGDFVVGIGENLAGVLINNILCHHPTDEKILRYCDLLDACRVEFANVLTRDALIFGDNNIARLVIEVEARNFTTQALRYKMKLDTFLADLEGIEIEELAQDLFRRQTDRFQQRRYRHFATAVYAEE